MVEKNVGGVTPEMVKRTGVTPEMGEALAILEQKHFEELKAHFGNEVGALAQFIAYGVAGGKRLGLSREAFMKFVTLLWDSAEQIAELVKSGRASGPAGYERLVKTVLGKRQLEVVKDEDG